jgi:pimeloyl-ACP methyl ester carboxylesterase
VLVVHGVEDILIPVENGRIVAEGLPGARLVEIEGMGHDLPERVWPRVIDAIADLAGQTAATRSA